MSRLEVACRDDDACLDLDLRFWLVEDGDELFDGDDVAGTSVMMSELLRASTSIEPRRDRRRLMIGSRPLVRRCLPTHPGRRLISVLELVSVPTVVPLVVEPS